MMNISKLKVNDLVKVEVLGKYKFQGTVSVITDSTVMVTVPMYYGKGNYTSVLPVDDKGNIDGYIEKVTVGILR